MRAEERAARSIKYLTNTDVLSSIDYEPEIKAEFIRVWNDAIQEAAKLVRLGRYPMGPAYADNILKLRGAHDA